MSGLTMIPIRANHHLTKNLNIRHEKFSFEVRVVQEIPKALQAIAVSLHCPTEVEGKFLILKMPCSSKAGFRGP